MHRWLPDRSTWFLLALVTFCVMAFWAYLFSPLPRDLSGMSLYALATLLLSLAFGSFCVLLTLVLSTALTILRATSKIWLPYHRAWRVCSLLLLLHLLASAALSALGLWGFRWPWYFGLFGHFVA
jgi:hypothetical protein